MVFWTPEMLALIPSTKPDPVPEWEGGQSAQRITKAEVDGNLVIIRSRYFCIFIRLDLESDGLFKVEFAYSRDTCTGFIMYPTIFQCDRRILGDLETLRLCISFTLKTLESFEKRIFTEDYPYPYDYDCDFVCRECGKRADDIHDMTEHLIFGHTV